MTDAAIHRVPMDMHDLPVRLVVHSGSPRAYALARKRLKCQTNRCSYFKSIIKSKHCICS